MDTNSQPPLPNTFYSATPKKDNSKLILFIIILLLILAAIGVKNMRGKNLPFVNNTTTSNKPYKSPAAVDPGFSEAQKTYLASQKTFFKSFSEKYPVPTALPIPQGLSDELLQVYNTSAPQKGLKPVKKTNFTLSRYFGDVAEGATISSEGKNAGMIDETWSMNKINGIWVLVLVNQQDFPKCADIQSVMDNLKPWQGECYESYDEINKTGKLIDGKHPNETYNNP